MSIYKIPNQPFNYQNFINGHYVNSSGNETFSRESPGHGVLIGQYPLSNKEDTDEAIAIAKRTFKSDEWSSLAGSDREKIIRKAASIIRDRAEELALIETLESGKPISQALDETSKTIRSRQKDFNNNLNPYLHDSIHKIYFSTRYFSFFSNFFWSD